METDADVIDVQAELDACESKRLSSDSEILANGWSLNNHSTRHQPPANAQLSDHDLEALELQWAFVFADDEERRGHPAVTTEAVILGSPSGMVRAMGRSTGCSIWRFAAEAEVRTGVVLGDDPGGEGRLLYFADTQAYVYALDAQTGEQRWKTRVDEHVDAIITGSPQLVADQLIVPVSSLEVRTAADPKNQCCTFQGSVVSLDTGNGEIQWRYRTISERPLLDPGTGVIGPSGVPVWGVPTIDRERGLVYIGTGENYSRPATGSSDAIIALELASGDERWRFQSTVDDVWNIACLLPPPLNRNCPVDPGPDLDFGAAPLLSRRPDKDDLLIAAQKSGDVYAIAPDTGDIIWHRRLGSGGNLGGIHWGITADQNKVYVPVSDIQSRKLTYDDLLDLENAATIYQPEGAEPGLYALNVDTGVTEWFTRTSRITPLSEQRPAILSAAITLADGNIYTGALDGVVRVFDSEDGSLLWETDTAIEVDGVNGVTGRGGTIDSGGPVVAGGMVYINSGYTTFGRDPTWFAGPGNLFMAFGVTANK